jgi:transposase
MAYFRHRITKAVAESINSRIQQIKANARGFRNFENFRAAILFYKIISCFIQTGIIFS